MTDLPGWVQALGGIVAGLGTGGLIFARRFSREKVEGAKDRAETGLISRLQHERDEAIEEAQRERKQRTDDARTIASLTSDNMHLRADVQRLEKAMRRMARGLSEEVQAVFQETGLGDLK